MKIGDRVRLLHSTEEGVIRRIIDKKTVDVEIEDGFLIPALISELVQIDEEELKRFKRPRVEHNPTAENESISTSIEEQGIFLAVEPQSTFISLWLLNNDNCEILFSSYEDRGLVFTGITKGILPPNNYVKLTDWDLKDQNEWPGIMVALMRYYEKTKAIPKTDTHSFSITNKILLRKPKFLNSLKRKVILLEIKINEPAVKLNPDELKNSLMSKHIEEDLSKNVIRQDTTRSIDLHIEALVRAHMPKKEEILDIQKEEFERQLDRAVVDGLDSILFIHGVGNGILRHLIHKYLSGYPHLRYYEDAQKEKFGYGATKVYLK
jgi:hypothetical protein